MSAKIDDSFTLFYFDYTLKWCIFPLTIPTKPNIMERTQVYITKVQKEAIEGLKQSTGMNKSEIIRRAIDSYLSTFSGHSEFMHESGLIGGRGNHVGISGELKGVRPTPRDGDAEFKAFASTLGKEG